MITEGVDGKKKRYVWVNTQEKIASFHYVEGYQKMRIRDDKHFRQLVLYFGVSGYRIQ